jgi:hypothetical protein
VLVCSERRVLFAGGWFVVREKYCWLVADKPNPQQLQNKKIITAHISATTVSQA